MKDISFFSLLYGILAFASLLLAFAYKIMHKEKLNKRIAMIFIVVAFVDFGHLSLSTSKSLSYALFANRFVYF